MDTVENVIKGIFIGTTGVLFATYLYKMKRLNEYNKDLK
jgi:hypothetical protein